MAKEHERTGRSPLVFLSFCLSLLAVAVSLVTLLMVNDLMKEQRLPRESLGVRRVEWKPQIERIEERLERIKDLLARSDKSDEDRQSLDQQLLWVHTELKAWLRAAEPHVQDAVAGMAQQAEDVRKALSEQSEQAAEKLEALRKSLAVFRERYRAKKPAPESTEDDEK